MWTVNTEVSAALLPSKAGQWARIERRKVLNRNMGLERNP